MSEFIKVINPFKGSHSIVPATPPSTLVHSVDSDGVYQGLAPFNELLVPVYYAPPEVTGFTWSFDTNNWERTFDIEVPRNEALRNVDSLALDARARFITVTSGQQEVYSEKLIQAQAYLDSGVVGGYLSVESNVTGNSLEYCANLVIEKHLHWSTVISPQIEGIRRASKLQISGSNTVEEIFAIVAHARSEFNNVS